jgi:hypothetical protein
MCVFIILEINSVIIQLQKKLSPQIILNLLKFKTLENILKDGVVFTNKFTYLSIVKFYHIHKLIKNRY